MENKLSTRLLKYIECTNVGLIANSAELVDITPEDLVPKMQEIVLAAGKSLNNYLDTLFELQTFTTFVEIQNLPPDKREDGMIEAENERRTYIKKVEEFNKQLTEEGD